MRLIDIAEIFLFFVILIGLTPVLGSYMNNVFSGKRHFMVPVLGWLERLIYRFIRVDANAETNWKSYTFSLLIFNLAGFIFVFLIQLIQSVLPLNPAHLPNVTWHLALNTAVSFTTNTNWQSYSGETTLSYFVQMFGLTVQNFVSASTGIAVLIALMRGLARQTTNTIGNFWVDMTRSTLYILIPLSLVLAVFLAGQGVIQNFKPYETVQTLQGVQQEIPMGPVASQVAIKQIGTNGGGFFGANSAHPFENPTPLTNLLELLAILIIPCSLTYTYGKFVGSVRQGWVLFFVMFIFLLAGLGVSLYSEFSANALYNHLPSMEGKEMRFGVANSVLWSTSTTAASNGSVNAMMDSMTPMTGMIAMINIMLGEIVFGGVGSGLYGMVIFVILTVFIAGLMVGRSPEYLGKKIEAFDVKMAMLGVLAPGFVILVFTALACTCNVGLAGTGRIGPHGFSEILYAYSSAAGNNGSAFAGLNSNTIFYNVTLALGMIIGRYGVIVPVLAIAGNLAKKKFIPPSSGTFRTDNGLFAFLLIAVILIVGGLTFFPALSLGPLVEHLLYNHGVIF